MSKKGPLLTQHGTGQACFGAGAGGTENGPPLKRISSSRYRPDAVICILERICEPADFPISMFHHVSPLRNEASHFYSAALVIQHVLTSQLIILMVNSTLQSSISIFSTKFKDQTYVANVPADTGIALSRVGASPFQKPLRPSAR